MNFVELERQLQRLQPDVELRISAVLEHGQYILGPEVNELEDQLAAFVGAENAIGVANGTDAITLSLMALGIGPGDAVFVPTFTFFATAEAVSLVGATPVFVDVDKSSYNMDPKALEQSIDQVLSKAKLKARCIIAVDLFGLPANYMELSEVAKRRSLFVIEDGAQGFGGSIGKRRACSFGDLATTSFFPAKPLGCYGDGGAVFTNDRALAEIIRSLRVHGKGSHKYDNVRIGLNSRLDTIQAAILLEKMKIFEEETESRRKIASYYTAHLQTDFVVPVVPPGYQSAWAQFTIRALRHDRDYYLKELKAQKIPTAIYYSKPLHLQPAFAQLGYTNGMMPVAEQLAQEVFSLPIHPYLTPNELNKVVSTLVGRGAG
jgi:dTDP-4-amino-4,6-dideoxygalactose transaminase